MKKKTKKMCKVLSVFLAFLIVAQILPLQVLAENITNAIAHQQFINDVVNNPTSEDNTSDAEILFEVEEKRDEYTKVYKKSDGSYTAIMTEEPLHYLYNGEWEEINNSMSLNGSLYTNLDNLFNVELPETIDSNENLTVEKDDYELSFSVDNIEESSAVVENDIVVSDINIPVADEAIAQTQSSVTYNDVAENTDLQYIVTPNSIKENIIVSSKESVKDTYTFTFETNGLDAEKLDDGSVVFKDGNDDVKFRIPRPVMTDANFTFSYDIDVVLIKNADETISLEYSPSSDWTNSSDRVYPITIDPAIVVENKEVSWVEDTYVMYDSSRNEMQNTNFCNDYVGGAIDFTHTDDDGNEQYVNTEIYTKFNVDALKSLGENVVFTEVQYLFIGASADGKALAKKIATPIDLTTVTYATKPSLEDEVIDYHTSIYSLEDDNIDFSYIHFNITKPLNEWFNGAENNGFAVTPGNEGYYGLYYLNGVQTTTSSSGTTTKTYTTAIVMDYVEVGGYNENHNYHSQSVGRAGTGYVNDFTQHLSVIRDDLSIDGNIMPVTVGMIYNSATYDKIKSLNYNTLMAYGNGWTPNYLRAFVQMSDNQLTYYTENGSAIDYTYTIENDVVTFEETYSDIYGEYGYEIEYVAATDTEAEHIVITRPDGYEERFNNMGLLASVTNPDYPSQKINIMYDSMYRIDYITDGVDRKYDYIYDDTTNLLSKVKCYGTNDEEIKAGSTTSPLEVNYAYDENKNLTSVTFPDGKSATYTYDANGNITSIANIDGYRIVYDYDANGKITNITEQALDDTEYVDGNFIAYECLSPTQIKLTDGNDNYEIYQFNKNGVLLYTIDNNGNYALNNDFGSSNDTYFISSNEYRANAENLLLNASFEKAYSLSNTSRAEHWESSSSVFQRTTATEPYFGEYVYNATRTSNATVYQKQTVEVLSDGEYTFSAYVKSDESNSGELYLNISSYNGSNTKTKTESISVESTGGEWQRYWVTLDAPSNTKKIVVEFGFKSSHGTYYVDNVQLEQTSSANEYNYIENGGFRESFECWEDEPTYSIVDTEINGSNEKAVLFNGDTDSESAIYQAVKINGKKDDIFTIGGWLKGLFVKSSTNNTWIINTINESTNIFNFTNDRFAQIEVSYQYTNSDTETEEPITEKIVIPFSENIDDWQFAAKDFALKGDCDEVLVVIRYSKNANSALVSNIELTKNEDALIPNGNTSETSNKKCKCTACEEPNCPCECTNNVLCHCVTCLRINNSISDDFGNIVSVSSFDGLKTINKLSEFTLDGNYLWSETDADNNTTKYTYDTLNGLLVAITDGENNTTTFNYDAYSLLTVISALNTNPISNEQITVSATYSYENDRLSSISHNGFSYNFSYDCWGQLINVSINTQQIISYEYGIGQFRNRVNKTIYHNKNANDEYKETTYNYDDRGNIIEILINEDLQFACTYDTLGNLIEISKTDSRTVRYTDFRMDILDANGEYIYSVDIDDNGNYVEFFDNIKYTTESYGISHDYAGGIFTEQTDITAETITNPDGTEGTSGNVKTVGIELKKDWFFRETEHVIKTESAKDQDSNNTFSAVKTEYQYCNYDENKTSNRIMNYINKVYNGTELSDNFLSDYYGFSYDYDKNGNIIAEYDFYYDSNERGQLRYSYVYDSLNQLVRFNDNVSTVKRSYTYNYDANGNILSKSTHLYKAHNETLGKALSTTYYEYNAENNWNDLLTKYDGQSIEYDVIGNATKIDEATLVWSGSELKSYTYAVEGDNGTADTIQIKYEYDENNLIHEKNIYVNGNLTEKYDYAWASGKLINQVYTICDVTPATSYAIKFIYDLFNTPRGFIINNDNIYLYVKNYQGDIIGVVDESGQTVLTYSYDVWGKPFVSAAEDGDNIDIINYMKTFLPFRYRGYFYDVNTGLYYIQNRYYNPEFGRFINADKINNLGSTGTVLSYNLFSYCENNPVMYITSNGNKEYSTTIDSNYEHNKELSKEITGFIHNQKKGSASQLRLGYTTVSPVGCGVVATYNALLLLGDRLDPCDIIREYEINGVILNGIFGLYQAAIARFFITKGYDVTVSFDVSTFEEQIKKYPANILFYSHSNGGHYIALTYKDSQYLGYNVYSSSSGVKNFGASLNGFLFGQRKGRVLISISHKTDNSELQV